jgi:purine-nucleoside phosphorylase
MTSFSPTQPSEDGHVDDAVTFLRGVTSLKPRIALVLGSGLGDFVNQVNVQSTIESAQIPHFPVGSVSGHAGRIHFGSVSKGIEKSSPFLLFQGRVHYYETGDVDRIVFPIDVAYRLGARILIVTNAAGGINSRFEAGQLMLIRDFLNVARKNPFFKKSVSSARKVASYFDEELQKLILATAQALKINLQEGVYGWLHGPSYETAAEIKMLRTMGADAVGMSTVPEIIRAKSLGMRVAGISLISNMATGMSSTKLSHQEVTATANKTQVLFTALIKELLLHIR